MFVAGTRFINVNGDQFDFYASEPGQTSIKKVDWTYEYDGTEVPKQQDSGNNPAHSFVRRMNISMDVQIIGTSYANYWTVRELVVKSFLVTSGTQTSYTHGTLELVTAFDGVDLGFDIYANVNVTSLSLPLTVDEAMTSVLSVQMRADRGYWLNTSDDTVRRI